MKKMTALLLTFFSMMSLFSYVNLTPSQADSLIKANADNTDLIIIDVRREQERETGFIPNSINIDYFSDTFYDEIEALDINKTYLTYCSIGGRGQNTASDLEGFGHEQVYNLEGGIDAWTSAQYDIVTNLWAKYSCNNEVKCYPNPTSSTIFFNGITQQCRAIVYNSKGQEISSTIISTEKKNLNVSYLSDGHYTIVLRSNKNQIESHKIIIKR